MYKSANYAQIKCDKCYKVVHIMPDEPFEKVDCDCNTKPEDMELNDLRVYAKGKQVKSAMQMGRAKILEKLKEV